MGCNFARSSPSLSGYSFHDKLGAGAFGQVRACTDNATGEEIAVKIVSLVKKRSLVDKFLLGSSAESEGELDMRSLAVREESLWRTCCKHRNVLTLHASFITPDFAFFLMERCACSLLDMLILCPDADSELDLYFCQMLMALEYVHAKSVIHRDIKPANFLSDVDETIKLCDFGLAIKKDAVADAECKIAGSALFMSPEMLLKHPYGASVDLWSLGVTIYLFTFGEFPYMLTDDIIALERSIKFNKPSPSYQASSDCPRPSSATVAFIKQLLVHDHRKRMTASQCLKIDLMARRKRGMKLRGESSISCVSRATRVNEEAARSGLSSLPSTATSYNKAMLLVRQRSDVSNATISVQEDFHDTQNSIDSALVSLDNSRAAFGPDANGCGEQSNQSAYSANSGYSARSGKSSAYSGSSGYSARSGKSGSSAQSASASSRHTPVPEDARERLPTIGEVSMVESLDSELCAKTSAEGMLTPLAAQRLGRGASVGSLYCRPFILGHTSADPSVAQLFGKQCS